MKKRLFSFVLVLAMCSMMFTGCGGAKNNDTEVPSTNVEDTWADDFVEQETTGDEVVSEDVQSDTVESGNEGEVTETREPIAQGRAYITYYFEGDPTKADIWEEYTSKVYVFLYDQAGNKLSGETLPVTDPNVADVSRALLEKVTFQDAKAFFEEHQVESVSAYQQGKGYRVKQNDIYGDSLTFVYQGNDYRFEVNKVETEVVHYMYDANYYEPASFFTEGYPMIAPDGSDNYVYAGGTSYQLEGYYYNYGQTTKEIVVDTTADATVETEEKEIDFDSMRAYSIGDMELMYSDSYERGQGGGAVVETYMNYYDFLSIFQDVDAPTSSLDPRNYGPVDLFMLDGEPTPVWTFRSGVMDECEFLTANKLGEEEDYNIIWGDYARLPEEMKPYLNEVLRTTYDMFFMSETEMGSKLGGPESAWEEIDSLGREFTYRNYGPSTRKNNDGIQISSRGDSEWLEWEVENFKHCEEWPVEKSYYFTIETEEGPSYYKVKITDFLADQLLTTGDYFNQPGVTAIYDEYSDGFDNFIKLELELYRLSEE